MNYFGKIKRYFVELWQAVSLFPCLLRGRSARVGGIVGTTSTYTRANTMWSGVQNIGEKF